MRGVIYMNVAMLAFTINDSFMKAVTQELPLFQAIALRGLVSSAVLIAIASRTFGGLQLWPMGKDRSVIIIRSIAEVGGTVLFLGTLLHMPLANLSAIMQSLPLVVTLAAALIFGDRVGWRQMLAILIGFGGVLVIIRPGTEGFDHWALVGLGSVACVVVRDLATRELSPNVPSVAVAVWASLAVTLMGGISAAFQGWVSINLAQMWLILGASAALIAGYLFVVMVMRVGDIGVVAPFRYMALIWAIIFGWVLFDTLPDSMTLIGSAVVVASGIYTLWSDSKPAQSDTDAA